MTGKQLQLLIIASIVSAVISVAVARWFDDLDHGRTQ